MARDNLAHDGKIPKANKMFVRRTREGNIGKFKILAHFLASWTELKMDWDGHCLYISAR
jgi:hypothetical protein